MNYIKKYLQSTLLLLGRFSPVGKSGEWAAGVAAGGGIIGLGAAQLLSMLGFSAVIHSSGAAILTGAGGYIAGTYGIAVIVGLLMAPLTLLLLALCVVAGCYVMVQKYLRKSK